MEESSWICASLFHCVKLEICRAISLGRGVVDYCASSTALLDIETLLQKWVLSFQKKTRKLQAALYACATPHPVMS